MSTGIDNPAWSVSTNNVWNLDDEKSFYVAAQLHIPYVNRISCSPWNLILISETEDKSVTLELFFSCWSVAMHGYCASFLYYIKRLMFLSVRCGRYLVRSIDRSSLSLKKDPVFVRHQVNRTASVICMSYVLCFVSYHRCRGFFRTIDPWVWTGPVNSHRPVLISRRSIAQIHCTVGLKTKNNCITRVAQNKEKIARAGLICANCRVQSRCFFERSAE